MTYHLSAVPRDSNSAVPASLRTAADPAMVLDVAAELSQTYPPDAYVVRLITSCRCCEDERVALRMLAAGRGVELDLI